MTFNLADVKALTFDVGGTVFDWYGGISGAVAALADRKQAAVDVRKFTLAWRGAFFEALTGVREGSRPRLNADELHRYTLDSVSEGFPEFVLTAAEKDQLTLAWHRLDAWPDAAPAIARLRERYEVVVLTVLSYSLVLESSKHAGLTWDGILSCEFLFHYKPDVEAYLDGLKLLQLEPAQCMMVAAHRWDLEGARKAGMPTAFVPRPNERGPNPEPDLSPLPDVDVNSTGFDDLARQLLR